MKKTNLSTKQIICKFAGLGRWPAGSICLAAALFIALGMAVQPASAQTVNIRVLPLRITVPDSGTTVTVLTNYVNLNGTSGTYTLSVDPTSTLPTGDSTVFSTIFGNSGSATFGTQLTNTAVNVANGVYLVDINANNGAGSQDDFYVPLQSGREWTGTTNLTTDWSSGASWVGGTPPGASSDVLFTSLGAETNDFISGVLTANSIVDQNFTVASLRFSQSVGGSTYHTIQINPGVTLALTGLNGLSLLQDNVNIGSGMFAVFTGLGGTLNVNNPSASVALLEDDSTQHTLDLSRLGNFSANVNRFGPGDYTLYPQAANLLAQGYSTGTPFTMPNKFYTHTDLALTNFISANYVDPNNYTNSETNRLYALEVVNNPLSAPSSSAAQNFSLGITNVFNLDGVCVGGFGGTTVTFNFNPSLLVTTNVVPNVSTNYVTNKMVAIFRNTDGHSRMSIFTVGDLAGVSTNRQGNTKPNVDFGTSSGYVDMLVDRFYMSRDSTNTLNSSGYDSQSTFGMGAGIINANTMVIGDQESGYAPDQGFVYGTMTVSNTGVVVVNNSLQLGYSTAGYNDGSLPGVSYGKLIVNNGATFMANTIGVGGPSGNSGEVGNEGGSSGSASPNTISLSGSTLIVSNVIGSASALATNYSTHTTGIVPGFLGQLTMSSGTMELFINGNNNGPYVNVCNVTSSGSNTLVIGSIQNVTVPPNGSTNIPMLWIVGGTSENPFNHLVLPAGFDGSWVIDATNSSILDLQLSSHTPKNLKWDGYASANWDTTTYNWLDLNTGLHTNYVDYDNVTFDDTATVISISIPGSLTPSAITVTNNSKYYTFSGNPVGGNGLTKAGTGTLEVDAPVQVPFQLNNGTLVGSGTIGAVTVAAGAELNYSGTINGNVFCSGLGLNPGTINGNLTLNSGGVFTNINNLYGFFTANSGSLLYNTNGANITYPTGLGDTGSIATNAIVINGGGINGDYLTDGGTFEDLGIGNIALTYLSVLPGGVFYPGNDALGTTVINESGAAPTEYAFPGALLLAQGSTLVLNVNGNGNNTIVKPAAYSFGASASAQTENGATLQINNLGSPLTAGESWTFFQTPAGYPFNNTGSSTNTFPVISPATPGPGLAWDVSQVYYTGTIGVVKANSGPKFNFTLTPQGTNMIEQFSWGSQYQGWRLEYEIEPTSVGIVASNSAWTGVSGSWTNLSETLTNAGNTSTTNPATCVFFRLVFP
jgi:hypothetical protein